MNFSKFFNKLEENYSDLNIVNQLKSLIANGTLDSNLSLAQAIRHLESQNSYRTKNFEKDFNNAFMSSKDADYNFVKLLELRNKLSQYSREEFDVGLNNLRKERKYSLEASEGLMVNITPEERQAGINELGRNLIYCKKNVYR